MNYYALIYDTVNGYVKRRAEFREQHLRVAREARDRGELIFGGAFDDPVDRAMIIFCVDDKSKVEEFARKDPSVVSSLVKESEVRLCKVEVCHERNVAAPAPSVAIARLCSA